ncbi:unnamed protein product [Mycena citricolor]|uniref:Uncharacterized protein n=1 Tax=Mycena citricolor TaxID=2018698 RepID=A0AAD2Q2Q5_9AGAR|nr:unnamed protein product [Mycena citricolor]
MVSRENHQLSGGTMGQQVDQIQSRVQELFTWHFYSRQAPAVLDLEDVQDGFHMLPGTETPSRPSRSLVVSPAGRQPRFDVPRTVLLPVWTVARLPGRNTRRLTRSADSPAWISAGRNHAEPFPGVTRHVIVYAVVARVWLTELQ